MKNLLRRNKTRQAEGPPDDAAVPQDHEPTEPQASASKPLPELPLFFMLSHLEEDGPVRLDGVKLGVCEVMGLEMDEPKLGAFAGALNALDFPVQLLVRQHPPHLDGLRGTLGKAQPDGLPPQTRVAAESLQRLLTDLETRDGILDRRFYAVCEFARSTSCAACWRGPDCPSTRSEADSLGCFSHRRPWEGRQWSSTRTKRSR